MTLNKGMSESSGILSDRSVKIAEREGVKQLTTTPLNSTEQGETWQHPCIKTGHMKNV